MNFKWIFHFLENPIPFQIHLFPSFPDVPIFLFKGAHWRWGHSLEGSHSQIIWQRGVWGAEPLINLRRRGVLGGEGEALPPPTRRRRRGGPRCIFLSHLFTFCSYYFPIFHENIGNRSVSGRHGSIWAEIRWDRSRTAPGSFLNPSRGSISLRKK